VSRSLVWVAIGAVLVTGCLRPPPKSWPEFDADPTGAAVTHGSLRVSIDPFFERERVAAHFGAAVAAEPILPLRIVLENLDATASYVVDPAKISVREPDMRILQPDPLQNERGDREKDAYPVAAILPFGVGSMVAAGHVIEHLNASFARQRIASTRLRLHTISPGEREEGILFLLLASDGELPAEIALTVPLAALADDSIEPIELVIVSGGAQP